MNCKSHRKPLQFASKYGEWELRFGPKNRFRVIDLILSRSPKMRAILGKAWEDIEAGRGVSHEDFWREFDPE